jgi:hypothetical protein
VISNKALLHVACSLRPAWEIIKVLKDKASLQSKNQHTLTKQNEVRQIGRNTPTRGQHAGTAQTNNNSTPT